MQTAINQFPVPIFFDYKTPAQKRAEGIRKAKIDLINDIMNMRVRMGIQPTATAFDTLYDCDIDELYIISTQVQDECFEFNPKKK